MKSTGKRRPKISFISLGCSKNLVDSERLAARLGAAGYEVVFDNAHPEGSVVVINTCGFIGDAKEESINTILEAIALKTEGKVKAVYAMGCLTQRYRSEITTEIPELDGIFGKFDWEGLASRLAAKNRRELDEERFGRSLSTPGHHAYIKISEGCNRFCAFCAIPLITGRHTSRTIEDILAEVKDLAQRGTKEFNVIAQDLSSYGTDLYGRSALAELIDRMATLPGVEFIRLHYAYPSDFPDDILPVMAAHPNVCRYLDIALQHIDDTVLSNMRRHIDGAATRALLEKIRAAVPGIHIRTTMMVGFPGETEEAFGRLLDFVAEQRFERLGAFAYCEEDDTFAARNYSDDIPSEVKQQRLDRLMKLQQDIAFDIAASKVGQVLRVIVDEENDEFYIGRTEFDSPEVDTNVLIRKTATLNPGDIVKVKIIDCCDFDLVGDPIQ